jgi:hypothetical protein
MTQLLFEIGWQAFNNWLIRDNLTESIFSKMPLTECY